MGVNGGASTNQNPGGYSGIHKVKLETEFIFHHLQSPNFDEADDLQEKLTLSFSITKVHPGVGEVQEGDQTEANQVVYLQQHT